MKGAYGKTFWYLWKDMSLNSYKGGDHFVNPILNNDGSFLREKTHDEAIAEIKAYLSSSNYLGRMSQRRVGSQLILEILDVTEYAIKKCRHGPNKQIDAEIEKNTVLKYHRLDDKDSYNPDTITHEDIIRAVHKEVFGNKGLNSYPPYDRQKEAHDKAVMFYNTGGTDFLLDCVMRFGKCFTSYYISKSLNAKRILILTGKPKVKPGWKNDMDHVMFPGYTFIDSQTKTNVSFSPINGPFDFGNNTEVIFASFQGAKRKNYVSRLKNIINQEIDLVIIDELHAYYSEDALNFVESLKSKRRLWVSGTPFVAYESGQFNGVTDTYRFTIMDLQKLRSEGHPRFKEFPEIQFWAAKFPDWTKSANSSKFIKEQGLNMSLLTSNSNGNTNYPKEVGWMFDGLSGGMSRTDSIIGIGTREVNGISPVNPNHIWFSVPPGKDDEGKISVASGLTINNEIKKHPSMKRYVPILLNDNQEEDDVNHHITQNPEGSCTISCRALTNGTKFPKMDMVVFLRETISVSEFWQTLCRALEPFPGKTSINIVCWSAELIVEMAKEYTDSHAQANPGKNVGELLEEFFSLMPTHLMGDGRPERLDKKLIYSTLNGTGSVEKSFKRRAIFNGSLLSMIRNDPMFASSFPDVTSDKGNNSVIISNEAPKGKNKSKKLGSNNFTSEPSKKFEQECERRIREFMALTLSMQASCIVHENYHIKTLADLKEAPTRAIDSVMGTGTKALLDGLLSRGWINFVEYDRTITTSYELELRDISQ